MPAPQIPRWGIVMMFAASAVGAWLLGRQMLAWR